MNKLTLQNIAKDFLFIACFYFILTFPMPYYIYIGGGVIDLGDRFVLENSYEQSGSYNLSYVSSINGRLYSYLFSFINPDWKVTKISDFKMEDTETDEDVHKRSLIDLDIANQNAIFVAYKRANKRIDILSSKMTVAHVDKDMIVSKPLQIGDIILKVDGQTIDNIDNLYEYISLTPADTNITFGILRGEEYFDTIVTTRLTEDDSTFVGLTLFEALEFDVDQKIDFTFSLNETGPSAGFMTSLAIYDSLIEEDLTNGYKIAGSGTIDLDGNVGEIGGIEFKLIGAEKGGCKIFFAASGKNYDTAIKIKNERNMKIDVISISAIDDAIEYLKSLKS